MPHNFKGSFKKGKYTVINCESCGFSHIYPFPDEEELASLYKDQYFENVKAEHLTEQKTRDLTFNDLRFETKLNAFESLVDFHHNKRFLDIGCGNGLLLKYFQEHGWEALGVEPSNAAVQYAGSLGVKVIQGLLQNIDNDTLGHFDAINLTCVLEHIPNPIEICETVYRLLEPGGIACFEVPNDFNELQMAVHDYYQKEMWWISVPDHINYFNFDTLSKLLLRTGFQIALKDTNFPMEMFILMGDDYVGDKNLGQEMHLKRVQFEKCLADTGRNEVKNRFYRALAQAGFGRSVIIYAKKPEK